MTEGRVYAFNHEVVPDYLRTKPEPEVEEKMHTLATRAAAIPQDTFQVRVYQSLWPELLGQKPNGSEIVVIAV